MAAHSDPRNNGRAPGGGGRWSRVGGAQIGQAAAQEMAPGLQDKQELVPLLHARLQDWGPSLQG